VIDPSQQAQLRSRFNPDGSDLRRAQLRMLDMLRFIDGVCTKNNIKYWIDSGTLLGAARHGGYIPWDDDTDICMPKADYQKFKQIMLTQNVSSEFVLQCDETDKGFFSPWDVLRDLKSEYIQDSALHNIRKFKGVQVDIFYQDDKVYEFARKWMITLYKKMVLRVISSKSWKAKLLKPFLRINYRIFKYCLTPILHLLHPKENEYYRMPYGASFKSIRFKKNIYPLQRVEFEGGYFSAPANVDAYLKDIYGDWQQVPDIDHIQTHNVKVKFADG